MILYSTITFWLREIETLAPVNTMLKACSEGYSFLYVSSQHVF